MRTKFFKVVCLICCTLLFLSVECAVEIDFYNDSPDEIVICGWYEYPDTNLMSQKRYAGEYDKWELNVKPFTRAVDDYFGLKNFKFLFKRADTLCAYVIHADTLEKYGKEGVAERRLWLHRYDVTLKSLKRSHTFHYPDFPVYETP